MRSKLVLIFLGASALFLAAILVVCCLVYANSVSTSSSEQMLVGQVKTIANHTNTLLTNGKTTSAIAAKKTAGLAEQIKAQNVQIKNLLVTDHAQNVANQQHQNAVSATRTHELQDIQTLIKNEAASSAYLKTGVDSLRTILAYIGGSLTAICQATPNCTLPKS